VIEENVQDKVKRFSTELEWKFVVQQNLTTDTHAEKPASVHMRSPPKQLFYG